MLNKVILMGRFTRDPELRYTGSGVAVCSFSLAVDRNFSTQGMEKQTDFINVVAWRQTAEFVAKYFVKGKLVALDGRLQTRCWDDPQGKRYATEVVADAVYFADSKKDSNEALSPVGRDENLGRVNNLPHSDCGSGDFDESDFATVADSNDDLPF